MREVKTTITKNFIIERILTYYIETQASSWGSFWKRISSDRWIKYIPYRPSQPDDPKNILEGLLKFTLALPDLSRQLLHHENLCLFFFLFFQTLILPALADKSSPSREKDAGTNTKNKLAVCSYPEYIDLVAVEKNLMGGNPAHPYINGITDDGYSPYTYSLKYIPLGPEAEDLIEKFAADINLIEDDNSRKEELSLLLIHAKEGNPEKMTEIGNMWALGQYPFSKNTEAAEKWFEMASDRNDMHAAVYRATLIKEKNGAEAIRLLDNAASYGNALAAFNLGIIYQNGILTQGIPPDPVKAKAYLWLVLENTDTFPGLYANTLFYLASIYYAENNSNSECAAILLTFSKALGSEEATTALKTLELNKKTNKNTKDASRWLEGVSSETIINLLGTLLGVGLGAAAVKKSLDILKLTHTIVRIKKLAEKLGISIQCSPNFNNSITLRVDENNQYSLKAALRVHKFNITVQANGDIIFPITSKTLTNKLIEEIKLSYSKKQKSILRKQNSSNGHKPN